MSELLILLILTVSELLGTGTTPDQLAAKVQQAAVANLPFPVAELAVEVTEETQPGKLDPRAGPLSLSFHFDEIYLDPLLVDDLSIDVDGLTRNGQGQLTIDAVRFDARISAEALTEALAQHAASLANPTVTLTKDGITLAGQYHLWLARVPFAVNGKLHVEQQTQLVFTLDETRMVGVQIPQAVNSIIEEEVNPVYDLAAFAERSREDIELIYQQLNYRFYLVVEELTPQDGHIIVAGKA